MAITRRGTVQAAEGLSVSSRNVTIPATVVAGDLLLLFSIGQGAVTYDLTAWTGLRNYQDNGNVRSGMWARPATAGDAGATLTFTQGNTSPLVVVLAAYGGASIKTASYTANWGGAGSPFNSAQIVSLGTNDVLLSIGANNQVGTSPTMSNAGTQQATAIDLSGFSGVAYELAGPGPTTPQLIFGSGSYAQIDGVVLTPAGAGTPVIYSPATLAATKVFRPGRVLKGRQSAALDDAAVA